MHDLEQFEEFFKKFGICYEKGGPERYALDVPYAVVLELAGGFSGSTGLAAFFFGADGKFLIHGAWDY
jgi:hypothetical protein